MGTTLQTMERGREMALRVIEELPFIVGTEAIDESKKHLALAFGQGASPKLFECTEESIGFAIVLSAMSGLYPGGPRPDVWLIPRKNKDTKLLEVNWQMASRGYQRLAHQTGYNGRAHVVHHHDHFEYEESEPLLIHRPDIDKEGTWDSIKLAYLKIVDPAGNLDYILLRKDQIDKRRRCAQTDKVWVAWPEEQTLKTMWSYAGARETWPTDARTRFAMAASTRMETGETEPSYGGNGRPLIEADLAPPEDKPEAAPNIVGLNENDVKEVRLFAQARGITVQAAFEHKGWTFPNRWGDIPASDSDKIQSAIIETGIENGGCERCGKVTDEQSFCSPKCEKEGKTQ